MPVLEILVVSGEWKEWKPDVKRDRNIWEFQRGYKVNDAGRHENNDQFNAFQIYLHGKRSLTAVCEERGGKIETFRSGPSGTTGIGRSGLGHEEHGHHHV